MAAKPASDVSPAVEATLAELEKWRRREADLAAELQRARRQVDYYAALAGDMKREIHAPRLRHLLGAMGR